MESKRLIRYFRSMAYWYRGLAQAAACWRAERDAGVKYTDEERAELWRASEMLNEARDIVRKIYGKRIGDAVVRENTW